MSRFGTFSLENIDTSSKNIKPLNTVRSETYIWRQFMEFCDVRKYTLVEGHTEEDLANILQDWAYNMRKKNGTEYKEAVVKTIWNVSAKLLEKYYFEQYNRTINPFVGNIFSKARVAKNTKRKELQRLPEKQKQSAAALTIPEIETIARSYNEDTSEGLQKKFFQIVAAELAWRGNEASSCMVEYFQEETNNDGSCTGRIKYNPLFSKTTPGGGKRLTKSKWLIPNEENPDLCPVRLYKKLISKRTENISIKRFFLCPNRNRTNNDSAWYKNQPVGICELSKWTRLGAEKVGLDTKSKKITNHSNRASTVSNLSYAGANLQEIIKITGHASTTSLEPYMKLNEEHHAKIIASLRKNEAAPSMPSTSNSSSTCTNSSVNTTEKNCTAVYNHCTFNFYK